MAPVVSPDTAHGDVAHGAYVGGGFCFPNLTVKLAAPLAVQARATLGPIPEAPSAGTGNDGGSGFEAAKGDATAEMSASHAGNALRLEQECLHILPGDGDGQAMSAPNPSRLQGTRAPYLQGPATSVDY